MTFEEAEKQLRDFARQDHLSQAIHKNEILIAFEVFWASNPRRHIFGDVCAGLVLMPEMLWTMVKQS